MKKDAKEKGITLVALVVTIIVLLILAGVSLSLVLGDNGIITRAQDAVMKYKEAEAEEQWQMDNFMANYEGGDAYARALQQKGLSATATESGYLAAEDAGDGKNVILYHYDNNGNVTETETLAYAPEDLFTFDSSTNAITGINTDYDENGKVYYEDDVGVHLGNITGTLVIPKMINGKEVISIKLCDKGNGGLLNISSIIVPNTVKEIKDYAFNKCSGVKSILLPESIESIGSGAFWECTSLSSISLPDSVTSIGSSAFGWCPLKDFSFPNGIKNIPNKCFEHCWFLRHINISSSLNNLEIESSPDPFYDCGALESITVDSNNPDMTSIDGVLMTKNMEKIIRCPQTKTSFTVPDGVITIGFDAFKDCDNFRNLIFPSSVSVVHGGALDFSEDSECAIAFDGSLNEFGKQERSNNITITVKSDEDRQVILSGQDKYSHISEDNIIVKP